jgi:hypothetical protein
VTFWDLAGKLVIGGAPVTLVGDLPTLAADIATADGKGAFALANDYDARNDVFPKAPIPEFSGTFTGLGHTIANLTIKKGRLDCQGLFSRNDGTISYLHLQAVKVLSRNWRHVGAIAGCSYGNMYDVSVDGNVSGSATASVGGIAGQNQGQITSSWASVSVFGGQAGGIAGENDGDLSTDYVTGSI